MIKRTLASLLVFTFAATVHGEEFETQSANDAQKKYQEAVVAARKQYLSDLTEAAKQAVDAGNLEEVVRIKAIQDDLQKQDNADDSDSIELSEDETKLNKARKLIEGTVWKYKPTGTFTVQLSFQENRRVKCSSTSWKESHYNEWDLLDERTLVMRRRPEGLWVFFFEDDMKSFRVAKLASVKYNGSGGTRVK